MSKPNKQLEQELLSLAEGLGVDSEASQLVLEAIARIRSQEGRIIDLEAHNSDMSWRMNPDRMGGQFTDAEIAHARSERW